jgi:hypothetical protein
MRSGDKGATESDAQGFGAFDQRDDFITNEDLWMVVKFLVVRRE